MLAENTSEKLFTYMIVIVLFNNTCSIKKFVLALLKDLINEHE